MDFNPFVFIGLLTLVWLAFKRSDNPDNVNNPRTTPSFRDDRYNDDWIGNDNSEAIISYDDSDTIDK